jgi:hypothetical protein
MKYHAFLIFQICAIFPLIMGCSVGQIRDDTNLPYTVAEYAVSEPASKLWVDEIVIGSEEIRKAQEDAISIFYASESELSLLQDLGDWGCGEIRRAIPSAQANADVRQLGFAQASGNLTDLFFRGKFFFLQIETGNAHYDTRVFLKADDLLLGDTIGWEDWRYFEGIDKALVLLWRYFGEEAFSYIATGDPTWVVGESRGSVAGVFLGPLPGPGWEDFRDSNTMLRSIVTPGIVFDEQDLNSLLSDRNVFGYQ